MDTRKVSASDSVGDGTSNERDGDDTDGETTEEEVAGEISEMGQLVESETMSIVRHGEPVEAAGELDHRFTQEYANTVRAGESDVLRGLVKAPEGADSLVLLTQGGPVTSIGKAPSINTLLVERERQELLERLPSLLHLNQKQRQRHGLVGNEALGAMRGVIEAASTELPSPDPQPLAPPWRPKKKRTYTCHRCGQPKKGHMCLAGITGDASHGTASTSGKKHSRYVPVTSMRQRRAPEPSEAGHCTGGKSGKGNGGGAVGEHDPANGEDEEERSRQQMTLTWLDMALNAISGLGVHLNSPSAVEWDDKVALAAHVEDEKAVLSAFRNRFARDNAATPVGESPHAPFSGLVRTRSQRVVGGGTQVGEKRKRESADEGGGVPLHALAETSHATPLVGNGDMAEDVCDVNVGEGERSACGSSAGRPSARNTNLSAWSVQSRRVSVKRSSGAGKRNGVGNMDTIGAQGRDAALDEHVRKKRKR